MSTVSVEAGQFGWDYLLKHEDGRTVLVQVDHDYPGLASNLGWSPEVVEPTPVCPHGRTDGSVDCDCGVKAGTFIASAHKWLDDHLSEPFEDPGYFSKPLPRDPWRVPLRSDDVAVSATRRKS